ncbi:hypothetical protein HKX48_005325 [Thoreauomyces humboldtii]|nr:hypothetical protein HKX48_005325 [Thoreauomyces humboldtii]
MSTSTSPTTYFISGANRGIGFGLATHLAAKPNTTVFAGVRKPSEAKALTSFASTHPNLHVIQYEATSEESARAAAQAVKQISPNGITHLIANAGIAEMAPIVTASIDNFRKTLEVNTIGPLIAFQAFWPLLKDSPRSAFFVISSQAGSLAQFDKPNGFPNIGAYGASKAAVNFVVRSIHNEHKNDGLVAVTMCPGPVQTDMGAEAAKAFGMEPKDLGNTVDVSVEGLIKVIEGTTKEDGGRFILYDGSAIDW